MENTGRGVWMLETYDALAASAANGVPYESPLGPPRRAT